MNRLDRWFGADETWERPRPARDAVRQDVLMALAAAVLVAAGAETMRSLGYFEDERHGIGWQYAAMLSAAALIPFRRVFPVVVTVLAGIHMVVIGILLPMTMSTLPVQLLYFFLIFSGVAWARDRRGLIAGVGLVLALMIGWVAWSYAFSSGAAELYAMFEEDLPEQVGLFSVPVAWGGFMLLNNALFFGGAIILGQLAWNGAHRTAQVVEQAATIESQSLRLRDQAVVAERLRIARELHDVVAHHVSVMGVQASAARRVMDRDPDAARTALGAVERSSRDAVGQMRDLLGTLRADDNEEGGMGQLAAGAPGAGGAPVTGDVGSGSGAPTASSLHRGSQPTLAELPALAESLQTPTCEVRVDLVESSPGAAGRVPPPVQLSAYRIVQEAVANVHKHSSARHANAVVRVDEGEGRLEVEVVDDGTPRHGTSGTGLGLRGMRERAHHLGGGVEVGPRQGARGWRVRVWFPIEGSARMGA